MAYDVFHLNAYGLELQYRFLLRNGVPKSNNPTMVQIWMAGFCVGVGDRDPDYIAQLSLPSLWHEFFDVAGIPEGPMNERMHGFLDIMAVPDAPLSERIVRYYERELGI